MQISSNISSNLGQNLTAECKQTLAGWQRTCIDITNPAPKGWKGSGDVLETLKKIGYASIEHDVTAGVCMTVEKLLRKTIADWRFAKAEATDPSDLSIGNVYHKDTTYAGGRGSIMLKGALCNKRTTLANGDEVYEAPPDGNATKCP